MPQRAKLRTWNSQTDTLYYKCHPRMKVSCLASTQKHESGSHKQIMFTVSYSKPINYSLLACLWQVVDVMISGREYIRVISYCVPLYHFAVLSALLLRIAFLVQWLTSPPHRVSCRRMAWTMRNGCVYPSQPPASKKDTPFADRCIV